MSEHTQSVIGIDISAEETADPQLSGRWLIVARIGWLILAAVALFILVTSLPGYALLMSDQAGHVWADNSSTSAAVFFALSVLASLSSALLSLGLAAMLFRRRFEDPTAAALSFFLLLYGVVMAGPLEAWSIYWIENMDLAIILQTLLMSLPMMALFLLFPNGRFVPAWTR